MTNLGLTIILISGNVMGQNKYPMKVAMVSIPVEDPSEAFEYYTDVLGFEEVMTHRKTILP